MTFQEWRTLVDTVMVRDYCIDAADAGWADLDLERFWRDGDTAEQFVEWFAEKYDLIPKSEWEWGYRRRG
jgi:hypothetical protein